MFAYFGYPTTFRHLKYNWERFVYEQVHNVDMKLEQNPFFFENFINFGHFFDEKVNSIFICFFGEIHWFIDKGIGFQSYFKILSRIR